MIPTEYFDRPDMPAKNSPVGKLMRKIHARFPHPDLETIRAEAREALLGVGGAKRVQVAYQRWVRGCLASSTTTNQGIGPINCPVGMVASEPRRDSLQPR